jgi:hypothetical protein
MFWIAEIQARLVTLYDMEIDGACLGLSGCCS